jgi:hypothetical protein
MKTQNEPAPGRDGVMGRDLKRDPVGGELERLVADRGNWLMAIALALTGNRADAEDLRDRRGRRDRRDWRGRPAWHRRRHQRADHRVRGQAG